MQTWYRSRALYEAVMKLAKSGRFDEAISMASGIPDKKVRSRAFNQIVVEMARNGADYSDALNRAIEVALDIDGKGESTKALMGLAFEFMEMDRLDDALRVAEHITDLSNRSKVEAEVALRLARKGDVERAMKIIDGILDEDVKTWATSRLAGEL
jgi:predicted negative regulator of RcsB-dependent stress response